MVYQKTFRIFPEGFLHIINGTRTPRGQKALKKAAGGRFFSILCAGGYRSGGSGRQAIKTRSGCVPDGVSNKNRSTAMFKRFLLFNRFYTKTLKVIKKAILGCQVVVNKGVKVFVLLVHNSYIPKKDIHRVI